MVMDMDSELSVEEPDLVEAEEDVAAGFETDDIVVATVLVLSRTNGAE
jgi:hypothetical protein